MHTCIVLLESKTDATAERAGLIAQLLRVLFDECVMYLVHRRARVHSVGMVGGGVVPP